MKRQNGFLSDRAHIICVEGVSYRPSRDGHKHPTVSCDPMFQAQAVSRADQGKHRCHDGARTGALWPGVPFLCPLSSSRIKSSCNANHYPPPSPLASRPVRMDWSTRRVVDLMVRMRISAGTLSPTVKREEGHEVSREGRKPHLCLKTSPPPSGLRGSPGLCSCHPSKAIPQTLAPTVSLPNVPLPIRRPHGL